MQATVRGICYVTLYFFLFASATEAYGLKYRGAEEDRGAHARAVAWQPHWTSQHSTFWFRRTNAPNNFTFICVDTMQGVHQLAFNHEKLARALRNQGIEASTANLPFTWISTNENCTIVKFRAGNAGWEWKDDDTLTPFNGDIDEEDGSKILTPMSNERSSVKSSKKTMIKFVNQMKTRVSLYWVDPSGKEWHYQDVEGGRMVVQQTHERHVWRVRATKDGAVIANFAAGPEEMTAVIKEGLHPARSMADSERSVSKRQLNGTDNDSVFFKNHNVWFRDPDGLETQMSTTGTSDHPFSNFTYYAPTKKFAVVFQFTPEQEHIVYEIESSPKDQLQPRLKQFQYLKPGDRVNVDRPRMFDLTTKKEVPTDDFLFQNPYRIDPLSGDGWNTEGTEFRFVFNQRGHQVLRIIGMKTNGQTRTVLEETSETFIDYAHKLYYREIQNTNTSEMIWASERDGWNHLYLYDLQSGKVNNRITSGEWVVRAVDYVDEAARRIWLKVLGAVPGQDPYYAHLARVNFDGSDFRILTKGDGSHGWSFSPDRRTFTDTWSRMDMAAKTVTRDAESGNEISVVEEGNLDWLLWPVPERFSAPGRDGNTMIHGLIFRPMDMNNNTKYPIIERIYAGPQDFYVPKEYMTDNDAHQLANLGFIVVLIDGMGTNWRSKAFHDICYKNLKDAGFLDRIAWIKAAASTRLWMDLDHVGVYGTSAGGQNAMGALLFHNDFYSVAVADSGCHDNRMDKLWWNEAWMGYPVDKSYEDSSNVVNASKLKGSLMLVVGELDTNVDPASTMQVVNALNIADKDYEFLFMPGEQHGVGGYSAYAIRRRTEFLYRRLKGKEPPI